MFRCHLSLFDHFSASCNRVIYFVLCTFTSLHRMHKHGVLLLFLVFASTNDSFDDNNNLWMTSLNMEEKNNLLQGKRCFFLFVCLNV